MKSPINYKVMLLVALAMGVVPTKAISGTILNASLGIDVTLSSIVSEGQSYSNLGPLLGNAGGVAVWAGTGRAFLVDPFTQTTGSAAANASLDVKINNASVGLLPGIQTPSFTAPAGALTGLSVGDHMVATATGQIQLFAIGDAAQAASAPYFGIIVSNSSFNTIALSFQYSLTNLAETIGSDGSSGHGQNSIGAQTLKFNGENFGDASVTLRGRTNFVSGSPNHDFNLTFQDTLNVRLDPDSRTFISFYNSLIATGINSDTTVAAPGPIAGASLPGVVMAIGGLIAWRRWRSATV